MSPRHVNVASRKKSRTASDSAQSPQERAIQRWEGEGGEILVPVRKQNKPSESEQALWSFGNVQEKTV